MRIVVDALGADAEAKVIIAGAIKALRLQNEYDLLIIGDAESFEQALEEANAEGAEQEFSEIRKRINLIETNSFVTNYDDPRCVIKERLNSSMVRALQIMKLNSDVRAMITAGSTGCALVGTCFHLGLKKGLLQPALASALPTKNGGWVILCDCGSNLEPKVKDLLDYATYASGFAKAYYSDDKNDSSIFNLPKVGLVNVGLERGKGTELLKEAYQKLEEASGKDYLFTGNIEGFDILDGIVDVAVCDGFTGNVIIKALEKAGNMAADMAREEGNEKIVERILSTFDYNNRAGAVFLGTNKTVIKAHGSATADTICSCVMQAIRLSEGGF